MGYIGGAAASAGERPYQWSDRIGVTQRGAMHHQENSQPRNHQLSDCIGEATVPHQRKATGRCRACWLNLQQRRISWTYNRRM